MPLNAATPSMIAPRTRPAVVSATGAILSVIVTSHCWGGSMPPLAHQGKGASPMTNHRLLLTARPTGIPGPEHFTADDVPIRTPEPGEMAAETVYISID